MTETPRPKAIEIINVSKNFGEFQALKPLSFDIYDNEFFTLLGPSGCGKTTLLRMIAGFERPSEGQIKLHGKDIENLPPHKRKVNTVFQSYALFPHMTISENIAYALENLKWERGKIKERVKEMLELVHMTQFAQRRPQQLSGGQRQRVALARALAPAPEVLLLDEPLSALDLKLRQAMREELRTLQRQTGITFVFVTHDQEEALDMSDRICVLGSGEIQQLSGPSEIYENPENRFVADFIGETNFFDVDVLSSTENSAEVMTPFGIVMQCPARHVDGKKAVMSIRPEKIGLNDQALGETLDAVIKHKNYLGGYTHYKVDANGVILRTSKRNSVSDDVQFDVGARVKIGINPQTVRVLGR